MKRDSRGKMSAVLAFLLMIGCLLIGRDKGLVNGLLILDPSASRSHATAALTSSSIAKTTTKTTESTGTPSPSALRSRSEGSNPVRRPPRTRRPIPITVLSGFLGSGKTSLLQCLLQNQQGLRIAVIVNDVASVNVDSKIVGGGMNNNYNNINSRTVDGGSSDGSQRQQQQQQQQQQLPAGIVQLENGCACCSLSEELLGSVSELVLLSDLRGEGMAFDHIVVELSGVADPRAVRSKFQEAILYDMPLMERVRLDTMVTVVDCSAFLTHLRSSGLADPREAPELFYRPGEEPPPEDAMPDWAEDLPAPLLEALLAGERKYGGGGGGGGSGSESGGAGGTDGVADLLVSQCEIADVCLLNKVDLCGESDLRQIKQIVQALNPRATTYTCQFGDIDISKVLGVAGGRGVVESGLVDDHKDAVRAATAAAAATAQVVTAAETSSHSHRHSHDPSEDQANDAIICSDPSHSHDHSHSHDGHSHGHHEEDPSCEDPTCTDPTHAHDHSRSEHFGLGSFVYRARRPFHPGRLVSFLRHMPIVRGLPAASHEDVTDPEIDVSNEAQDALRQVLRSKGFAWSAESDVAAWYWSHAGVSFDLSCLGRWWATLRREDWPSEAVDSILADFASEDAAQKDPTVSFVGDRRQEIVFIGPTLGASRSQKTISDALDQCLLNDDEWQAYCRLRDDDKSLQSRFPNAIETRMLTY
jgi:G3E family GTPase